MPAAGGRAGRAAAGQRGAAKHEATEEAVGKQAEPPWRGRGEPRRSGVDRSRAGSERRAGDRAEVALTFGRAEGRNAGARGGGEPVALGRRRTRGAAWGEDQRGSVGRRPERRQRRQKASGGGASGS